MIPKDPNDGDIYVAQENEDLGGAIVVELWRSNKLIGTAQELKPSSVNSRHYYLTQAFTGVKLRDKGPLRIRMVLYPYISAKYTDGWGWSGYKVKQGGLVMDDGTYTIKSMSNIPYSAPTNIHVYEELCLIKEI